MNPLSNDPEYFAEDALDGFVAAYADLVAPVPGGVVRHDQAGGDKVAVVIGGGSGHYPAFCGLVGRGLADGAVVGNIFTSPSATDAESVARAVHRGAGVLLLTGNYAGDVMNFTLAARRLEADGIAARYLVVTDDVASAPREQESRRRGIAGDLVVFKIAGAAAEAGYALDEVERAARRANERTRTLGVAFDGCTLPGGSGPLFTVPVGMIGVGVGIHGEPGIAELPVMSARELATLLVERVLADAPVDPGSRVTVLLNGLGRTKYEELFVLWSTIAPLLRDAGLTVVRPEIGELVTSLDMAGCSLTVTSLDDELETLWLAPAFTPAFRNAVFDTPTPEAAPPRRRPDQTAVVSAERHPRQPVGGADTAFAAVLGAAIDRAVAALAAHESLLGKFDAIAGDGDHGRGMVRGARAAQRAAQERASEGHGAAGILGGAGKAWVNAAGGTSGMLWGVMLESASAVVANADASSLISQRDIVGVMASAVKAAAEAVREVGGAETGDKTILDAIVPFGDSLTAALDSGDEVNIRDVWRQAVYAAMAGAVATMQLSPRRGRARPLATRSVGHPDPGAVSFALTVAACLGEDDLEIDAFITEVDR